MLHAIRAVIRISHIFPIFFSVILFMHAANVAAEDKTAKNVAVLPFEMHAPSSMAYLQDGLRDMLASRLAANGGAIIIENAKVDGLLKEPGKFLQQGEAVELASQLGLDYIVTGSLTSLGGSMSLDAKVFGMDNSFEPMSFYATAAQESEVVGAINQLSWDIAAKVFGAKPPAAVAPATAVRPSPAVEDDAMAPFKTEHPDKAHKKQSPAQASGMVSPLIMTHDSTQGFTKTQNVDFQLRGLDIGDVDGDGELDVVMADKQTLYAYHLQNNKLAEFGSVKLPARSIIHAVSLADLDGNGKSEIYISAADDTSPHSWAYEWNDTDFSIISDDVPWYIRTVQMPGEGLVLVGQRGGNDSVLLAGIFRLMRNGKKLQPQERLIMPNYVNLFDFSLADVTGDGNIEIVGVSKADRLYVVRSDGSVLWVSDNYYSGTRRYIGEDYELYRMQGLDTNSTPDYNVIGKEGSGKRIYIPSRMIVMDVNHDGRDDIIVNRNVSTAFRVAENFKRYKTGEIGGLTWNGIGLTEIWQTKKIDGYIPDFQFLRMPGNDNTAQLYVGLVLRTSGWSGSLIEGDSTILMYNVELSGEKDTDDQKKQ